MDSKELTGDLEPIRAQNWSEVTDSTVLLKLFPRLRHWVVK